MPNRKIETEAPAFGKRLVELLKSNDVPRRGAGVYLQRKYGVSNVTANDWLNGKFRPGPDVARRIAADHGSTFDQLYFGRKPSAQQSEPDMADLESDIRAISVALGALAATMVQHRPAEAVEAADALVATTPEALQGHHLIRELTGVLGKARRGGKRGHNLAS